MNTALLNKAQLKKGNERMNTFYSLLITYGKPQAPLMEIWPDFLPELSERTLNTQARRILKQVQGIVMSGLAIHSTQENSNSDRLYMYKDNISRLGNLPKTLVQFSVLCGCSTDKVKRELRSCGYTFSKLRNEERNRRILMLDRKIKILALYQEMGFSTKNGFSEWHIKYYGFSWSERKFDDLSRYGYRNATDCKHL